MDRLCTYFDANYLARGLALHESLMRHWPDFELWALCLDDVSSDVVGRMALPRVRVVTLAALERHDPALPAVRATRSRLGYYFTTTPILARHVLDHAPDAAHVFYLDADLFFFSSPAPIHDEFAPGSILIHKHGIKKTGHPHGTFNVGLVGFKRDQQGLACLDLWRRRCLDWCDVGAGPGGAFGDQKYLDDWPGRFSRTVVARGGGIAYAPWNIDERTLTLAPDGIARVDDGPLVFFHFHGMRGIGPRALGAAIADVGMPCPGLVRRVVYRPYVRAMYQAARRARRFGARNAVAFPGGVPRVNHSDSDGGSGGGDGAASAAAPRSLLSTLAARARLVPEFVRRIHKRHIVLVARGRAF